MILMTLDQPSLQDIHLSPKKNTGWLGYIGDEILPSFIGTITNHFKGSLWTNQYNGEKYEGFFRGSFVWVTQENIILGVWFYSIECLFRWKQWSSGF